MKFSVFLIDENNNKILLNEYFNLSDAENYISALDSNFIYSIEQHNDVTGTSTVLF